MNCVCGAKLEEIKTQMDFFDGKIIARDVNAFYCPECKEELFDAKEWGKLFEFCNLQN
ncbi:MAG: YgiT-type zinc finger protein [archaeon]|nr:YgiT-type zinc finger protein [archaeon]